MTGKFFFVENKKQEANIIFHFLNGKKLFFCDPRGFGVFYLQKIDSFHNLTPFKRIGPDIIQEKIDPSYLYFFFKKLKITVKEALLEQKIMSGIGNIYASEILFACKINPLRLTNEINYKEIEKIIFFSRNILEESIKLGGTSIIDFISPEEKKGLFKNKLNVYMRKNKECYLCRSLIKEIKLNR